MNLKPFVNTLNILNYSKDTSTVSNVYEVLLEDVAKSESYIVSDCDQEMLLIIKFNQDVIMEQITFHASSSTLNHNNCKKESSPPKLINIYKTDNISINFNDISSLKPNKCIDCKIKKLNNGQTVKFRNDLQNSIKFSKVRFLVIFIKSNQKGTEKTFLNGITINGMVKHQQIDADAFDPCGFFERELITTNKTDFEQSRIAQNHLNIIRAKYFQCVNYKK
eukprot:539363_1